MGVGLRWGLARETDAAALLTGCCWARWSPIGSRGPAVQLPPEFWPHLGACCAVCPRLLGVAPSLRPPTLWTLSTSTSTPSGHLRTLWCSRTCAGMRARVPSCLTAPHGAHCWGHSGCLQPHLCQLPDGNQSMNISSLAFPQLPTVAPLGVQPGAAPGTGACR